MVDDLVSSSHGKTPFLVRLVQFSDHFLRGLCPPRAEEDVPRGDDGTKKNHEYQFSTPPSSFSLRLKVFGKV